MFDKRMKVQIGLQMLSNITRKAYKNTNREADDRSSWQNTLQCNVKYSNILYVLRLYV